jgi:hypothetical protein
LALAAAPLHSEEAAPAAAAGAERQQAERPVFVYQPPNRGAPAQRVGGGTRSISQLSVLAPPHTGVTTQLQPRLYWFINPGFRNKMRFRLAEAGATPPLLEIQLPPQPNGGIQYLDLKAHNVRLEPGKLYDWGVMLEPFPHQRLPPLLSQARLAVDDSYAPLQQAPLPQKAYLAAQQGYWYDALDWISQLIEAEGGSTQLRLQRADLLEQGELLSATAYEREMSQDSR